MKKFNLSSLENKLNDIEKLQNNIDKQENIIIQSGYKKCNNKAIETMLYVLWWCFEEDYKIASEYYYECIKKLSDNYLLGSEWYIGLEYTREYYFNTLDLDIQYKFYGYISFLSSIYQR